MAGVCWGKFTAKTSVTKGRGRKKASENPGGLKTPSGCKAFSAVILAGEKPARMMSDKSFVKIDGRPLLSRQIELVRAAGATEVFISGRDEVDYSIFGCPVLKNEFPFVGTLAGIERALSVAAHPLLLVLAVDLRSMRLDCLKQLAATCSDSVGAVPCRKKVCEPLAAFYPRQAHSLAWTLLGNQQFAAFRFAENCFKLGLVHRAEISAADAGCFFTRKLQCQK